MSEKPNFKFQEDKILKELYDYVSTTYKDIIPQINFNQPSLS